VSSVDHRSPPKNGTLTTSLGPTLEHHSSLWALDLTELPIFHGLSVISQALGNMVIDQAKSDRIDINVERAIWARENPELLRDLGVVLVKVTAEHDTVADLVRDPNLFQDQFRAVFGTLQRDRYRRALFPPEDGDPPHALAFRFVCPDSTRVKTSERDYTFLLERVISFHNEGQCYLRITIEDPARPRLALDAIPHLAVEDLDSRTFIAGSTRIAETWTEGLRREAERGHRTFVEKRTPQSHLFKQFGKAGLDGYEKISLTWTDAFVDRILESDPSEMRDVLKRVLLALEDGSVRRVLKDCQVVRIICEDMTVYLDESELGRVLNLSIGGPRERLDLDAFLDRMPETGFIVGAAAGALAGVHVFLIHHITAEVLGLIAALRRLGCRDLTTLFVAYAGEAPSAYLGPLLELPPNEFRCLALVNVPDDESVEGHYRLSTQYSRLESVAGLGARLAQKRMRFFEAMQTVAIAEFMHLVARAERGGGRCLILEDGGYLAPAINVACREGRTVAEFLGASPEPPDNSLLKDRLDSVLIGSVEHTRNGMNRLLAAAEEYGDLAFPAFTIAASRRKIEVEAREVAVTVLNAVENVLHATGRILSRRQCVVLGSRGAIGSHLVRGLRERLIVPAGQLAGVDLKVTDAESAVFGGPESPTYAGLPEARRLGVDLILGVTGESVLQGKDLEHWLLRGDSAELAFASGSTKTEEFRDLATWLDGLLNDRAPRVGGWPVRISVWEVKDPITNRLYSHRYRFDIQGDNGQRRRDVVFLANLTPVNFMFYGVPTEVIDGVLSDLLGCGLGLLRRAKREEMPRTLQVVDRDITASGEPM